MSEAAIAGDEGKAKEIDATLQGLHDRLFLETSPIPVKWALQQMGMIDAGIGTPSHAAQAMEMGYDAVLLNTAVAQASHPVMMAQAFHHALVAGRLAYQSGAIPEKDLAQPSTPVVGTPFWHHNPS